MSHTWVNTIYMVHHNRIITITKKKRESYRTPSFLGDSSDKALSTVLGHRCSFPANILKRPAVPPIKEKQTGRFDFVNLTCEQHDRAKNPSSPAVSWGLCLCVRACAWDWVRRFRQREKFRGYICLHMHNVLSRQSVWWFEWGKKKIKKNLENVSETQIASRGRWRERWRVLKGADEAGAVRSPVRSAGETQFTLPCRHPG